jgi:adenylate kinase
VKGAKLRLIILGPPGSGKGTQASILARKYGLLYLATGDIFREEIKRKTDLGKQVEAYMTRGELVPDELVVEVIRKKLESGSDGSNIGFILDGFPRTERQAEELDKLLNEINLKLSAVLLIDVPDEEVVKRLSGRRICEKCGAVYHVEYNPPKIEGICDICGGKLVQREDDKPEVVRRRLQVYHEQTDPVISFYEKSNLLYRVDGLGEVEEVHRKIEALLEIICDD